MDETIEYAADMAQSDPFDLRTTRLAINQAQDAMGFIAHMHNAQSTCVCRRMGSLDRGCVLPKARGGKRQPLVQVVSERYERDQQRWQPRMPKSRKNSPADSAAAAGLEYNLQLVPMTLLDRS